MKKITLLIFLILLGFNGFSQTSIQCVIKTSLGDIYIELYPEKAPITVNNFMQYVDNDLFKNSNFFRTCTPENEANREYKIEVIQGGNIAEDKLLGPIPIETTEQTKILHKHGTISMARAEPNTAQSNFFICINDQPELDFNGKRNPDGQGFAAFGQVSKGMDIVLQIQAQKNEAQMMPSPIVIYTIKRLE